MFDENFRVAFEPAEVHRKISKSAILEPRSVNLCQMDLQTFVAFSRENLERYKRLVRVATDNPDAVEDILRAIIVMEHAYLEDFLRTLAETFLPNAGENILNRIPLAGRSGRTDKFSLGALVAHRGKTVDGLIRESVTAHLAKSSYNSTDDIAVLLGELGFDVDQHNKGFALINELIQRRHQIVHRADRTKDMHGRMAIENVEARRLAEWNDAIMEFENSIMMELAARKDRGQ